MTNLKFNPVDHPHRRFNPLTGKWVLISPHRGKRPWGGQSDVPKIKQLPEYDEMCFLCPNNVRISKEKNPNYKNTYVFNNDYSALMQNIPKVTHLEHPLFKMESARGSCRVICFSPDHSKTMPELSLFDIEQVIATWNQELESLGKNYLWVQVFENKGAMMGCSQPHPHGQIWASDFLPSEISIKEDNLKAYYETHETNLLLDYVDTEIKDDIRTVVETTHWIAVVPYWACWPFETMLMPKQKAERMSDLNEDQLSDLAIAIKKLTSRYDNLFQSSFPYSMGWHYAPFFKDKRDTSHWQLHALFYPPLLRSASVQKFMVGYEMLAESQRDLTAEQAAQKLREVSDIHFKSK
ncbi:MAG: UDP-glucose--hexose-1-phosphate uridylyltransferase [Psychromonas sp.]|nr:UDP-glucose--hexose-1-phosphate uridylyltransferase [Psychromonas sp.]